MVLELYGVLSDSAASLRNNEQESGKSLARVTTGSTVLTAGSLCYAITFSSKTRLNKISPTLQNICGLWKLRTLLFLTAKKNKKQKQQQQQQLPSTTTLCAKNRTTKTTTIFLSRAHRGYIYIAETKGGNTSGSLSFQGNHASRFQSTEEPLLLSSPPSLLTATTVLINISAPFRSV